MARTLTLLFLAMCCTVLPHGLAAQQGGAGLSALAQLQAGQSEISETDDGLAIRLAFSQPVPWRVRVIANPPRLILDMREVDWSNLRDVPLLGAAVLDVRAGVFRPTWSRLVVHLAAPMLVARAQMQTEGAMAPPTGAVVDIILRRTDAASFAAAAALPEPPEWQLPKAADLPASRPVRGGPLVVVLDPGHGGLDPGAQQGDVSEANLMLTFARELKEALLRTGKVKVVLTRDADLFVPLEGRISIARAAAADVFLSLHADAVAAGVATGATIYTLSDSASDAAAQTLAERHDRDDLLAGVDLTGQDDLVAHVLMDMARLETQPRIARLARALETAIKASGITMHSRPHQTASFSVLKSPDIPSALIELGFMSSASDLANLQDKAWRARMVTALKTGLLAWADGEAAIPAAR